MKVINKNKISVFKFIFLFSLLIKTLTYAQDLSGTWQGRLIFTGGDLRIVFHFNRDSTGAFTGTTDSPDQAIKGTKLDDVVFMGDSLSFSVPEFNGEYSGVYHQDNMSFNGHLKQQGLKIPLKLVKGEADDLIYKRPQKPIKPYPYVEEEVTVQNKKSGETLSGTFTKPNGHGKFPAVILITGSGPEDRDETVYGHKPFLLLSDYLTRKGFAVLRCDDRGMAKSTGTFATATPDDFATDVEAQIDYLKTRSDVDAEKLGLIGHSEGAIIAPMVAVTRKDIAFIVMMAGPGIDMFDLLLVQDSLFYEAEGETPAQISEFVNRNKRLFAMVKTAKDSAAAADSINNYLSSVGTKDHIILTAIRQLCTPWMRWYIGFDPRKNLQKIQCPVLAINGEKDVQVPASIDIASIEQTLKQSGSKNFKTIILPGLNHLFQRCKKCSVSEYVYLEETMDPTALSAIGDWMEKNFLEH